MIVVCCRCERGGGGRRVEAVQLPCTVYIYLSEWLLILILVYLAEHVLLGRETFLGFFYICHLRGNAAPEHFVTFCLTFAYFLRKIRHDICLREAENV